MASDTASTSSDEADLALSWSGRWTLGYRIFALNILTLLLVALSTLYLDVFRNAVLAALKIKAALLSLNGSNTPAILLVLPFDGADGSNFDEFVFDGIPKGGPSV